MIKITLTDGSIREYNTSVSAIQIAQEISSSLAKNALLAMVDDEPLDLSRKIEESASLKILTYKDKNYLLPVMRHDMAHLLGEAILELYPNTKLATGPATENGFFYDFLPENPFSTEDLVKIEQRMRKIIDRKEEVTREVWERNKIIQYYQERAEIFKVEILKKITDETVSMYRQGNFLDLCRGPHLRNTGLVSKAFKLTKVSAVYWKGDVNNQSLQRIYGIGFLSEQDLKNYFFMLEEAEKRDHRKLGKEMGLFHFQEEATGMVFWHEQGYKLYRRLEDHIRQKLEQNDYNEVRTPQIFNKSLWEKSGHWDKFRNDMFIIANDNETLALKPMNCPAHVQIFKQGIKSYKDLPIRIAEFGSCHRNEPSGALHGLMRVRAFVQDDAHIFCTKEQISSETQKFCALLKEVYQDIFGAITIKIKFSDRPKNRAGDDKTWDIAEFSLRSAAEQAGLDLIMNKGEGAFYGPKLEFVLTDSIGREWQLGTLQVDFILPERLGAHYVDEVGNKCVPIMLHRAILGSFERFIGILLEHYGGKLPLWLAPTQIALITVTNQIDSYAIKVLKLFKEKGIAAILDTRSQTINHKIREHSLNKVPIIGILGEKEKQNQEITLRYLGEVQQKSLDINVAIANIVNDTIK